MDKHPQLFGMAISDNSIKFSDEETNHLVKIRFDEKQLDFPNTNAICNLCHRRMVDDNHTICCNKQRIYLMRRHDDVVRYTEGLISPKRHPDTVCCSKGNIRNGMKPDIIFQVDNKHWVIDVAFCKEQHNMETYFKLKKEKYEKYYDGVIPLIFNYKGLLYKKSCVLLKEQCPEVNVLKLINAA